jgi:hypothetical protein
MERRKKRLIYLWFKHNEPALLKFWPDPYLFWLEKTLTFNLWLIKIYARKVGKELIVTLFPFLRKKLS